MSKEKLYEKFKQKAEAVSAEVHRCKSPEEATDFILKLISELKDDVGTDMKTVWSETQLLGDSLKKVEAEQGVFFGDDIIKEAESSYVGVSQLDVAIAESGSLGQDATNVLDRMVSSLSTVHVAVLSTNNLVENITDYLTKLNQNVPGYVAFITGPSRTADIERVLTIGVHGPERLIVVFVDGGEKSE
ncbi:L-lactate dehydrogenase complex protein LldG [Desulfitispora alkaliphila]|uniref:LutC/YkgG family protein n=1 Tax=Desulfitispora alkaliphila TaxID=622674 RepID=UPI003D24669D